jgi:integrase
MIEEPQLLDRLKDRIRLKHFSIRTEKAYLDGTFWIMAHLLYGAGLRLMECIRLRVKDVDFEMNQLTIRDGKGRKDRVTMLPEIVKLHLKQHLEKVKIIHKIEFK